MSPKGGGNGGDREVSPIANLSVATGDPAWPNAQSWLEASWCQPSSERHFIHVSFLTNPMCSALPQIAHGKLGPKVPFPLHGLWVWPSVSLYALWARELILPPTESSTHLTTVSPEQTWSPEGDWPTYQREPDCQLSGTGKAGQSPRPPHTVCSCSWGI